MNQAINRKINVNLKLHNHVKYPTFAEPVEIESFETFHIVYKEKFVLGSRIRSNGRWRIIIPYIFRNMIYSGYIRSILNTPKLTLNRILYRFNAGVS